VIALLLAAALAPGQAPARNVTNAQVDTRQAAQTIEREVAALAARKDDRWVAYRIPVGTGRRSMECYERSRITLEPAREIFVLARLEGGTIVRLRTATPDCEIDAGGLPVVWFEGVKTDDSAAWLTALLNASPATIDYFNRVARPALVALGAHDGSVATRALVAAARDHQNTRMRSDALFWLGQRAGNEALATIAEAIDRDPETEVKRRAVFALSQLPKDEGVPKLIEVARANKNPVVRKQAMFWLGQSNDPRALKFFEEILLK
jgi:HEAT repeat protein